MTVTATESDDQFDDLLEGLEPEVPAAETAAEPTPVEEPAIQIQDEFEGIVVTFRGNAFPIPMTKDLE